MDLQDYVKRPEDRRLSYSGNNILLWEIFTNKTSGWNEKDGALLNRPIVFSYAVFRNNFPTKYLSDKQEIFYVVNGSGKIRKDKGNFEIKKEDTFLVPPNVPYEIVKSSKKNLEMLVVSEKAPKNFGNEIVLRNSDDLPFVEISPPLHWCHKAKGLFDYKKDNLSQIHYVSLVYIGKNQLPEPHKHFPGHDEVWHALEGRTKMAFKNKLIEQAPGISILIPDDGKTEHASITEKEDAKFFFFMHYKALDNRLLITGSEGKVGTIVKNHLRENGYQLITELDKENPRNPVDILATDINPYFREIDTVIHLAANPRASLGKKDADKNIEIARKVINACRDSGVKRIINGSSINVYPYTELSRITKETKLEANRAYNREGHYGMAKIESERLFEEYCRESRVSLLNLRLGEITEADKDTGLKRDDLKRIILQAIKHTGIDNYVCVSRKGRLVAEDIRFPI